MINNYMNKYLICRECKKTYKSLYWYKRHIEIEHKENCNCGGGRRGKYPLLKPIPKKKMNKIFSNAEKKIKTIEANVELQVLLTDKTQEIFKNLPLTVQKKIKKVFFENEYLKGMIKSKNSQIRELQKNVNKCIDNIGAHYSICNSDS